MAESALKWIDSWNWECILSHCVNELSWWDLSPLTFWLTVKQDTSNICRILIHFFQCLNQTFMPLKFFRKKKMQWVKELCNCLSSEVPAPCSLQSSSCWKHQCFWITSFVSQIKVSIDPGWVGFQAKCKICET